MRNTNLGYDAFRIICPSQEATIRRGELATLQKSANDNPGKLPQLVDLAGGYDKLATALSAQGDSANALLELNNEFNIYQYLESRAPGNLTWQRNAAQLFERIGDLQFAQAKASNQAGNAQQSVQQVTAAIASYQKGLAIREQLLHAAPEDVDAQLNAVRSFNQIGTVLYWSRHPADAANAIRKSVQLLENIVDTHHDTPKIRMQLIMGLYDLSFMSDNATEARDALRKSLAIATEMDSKHEDPEEMVGVVASLQEALAKLLKQPTPPSPPKPN
jgi:tetratricopeptide (TPR) repeat protein